MWPSKSFDWFRRPFFVFLIDVLFGVVFVCWGGFMISTLKNYFLQFLGSDHSERKKFLLLATTFFLVIAAYTILRDLKNSVFISLVGKEYIPKARMIVLGLLVPAILLYSKLVDKIRRYYLLILYSSLYAVVCLIFAFFLYHPTIGIRNTDQSVWRLFGWIFYFVVEGYSPFVLSVFWAFSNSVNSPESAKKNYGFMVSGSKAGGMFTAGLAWALFSMGPVPFLGHISDAAKHSLILAFAAVFLCCIPLVIFYLMKTVPGRYLHGYEAVYKVEKQRGKTGKAKTGVFAGLKMLVKYPYVLGIFSMVFFYEILATVLSYLRLGVAKEATQSIAGLSGFLFKWVFFMHTIGLFISLLGTSSLLRKLGTRTCVMLIPITMGVVVLCFILGASPTIIMGAFTLMKSVNYAFSSPVRESLYIPTLKEIKFKSKSWIDAFGNKFAKFNGSIFNDIATYMGPAAFMPLYSFFFALIIGLWFFSAFLLGMRFDRAVAANEVVGMSEDE